MTEQSQWFTRKVYFLLTLHVHCGLTVALLHVTFTLAPGQGAVRVEHCQG